jgi:hypothetical protein
MSAERRSGKCASAAEDPRSRPGNDWLIILSSTVPNKLKPICAGILVKIVKQQYTKLKPDGKRIFGLSEKPDRSDASSRPKLVRAWPDDG